MNFSANPRSSGVAYPEGMGGPAASVLLKNVLEPNQIDELRAWVGEVAEFYAESKNGDIREGWEVFVRWPTELGEEPELRGPCLGAIQLFTVDPGAESSGAAYMSPGDWEQCRDAIGWMPASDLSVSIFCNDKRDHKTLAWLCSELADRFDGLVDLGGTLPIPDRKDWDSLGLSGSVVSMRYEIDNDRWGHSQVVDSEFLRGWIRQPGFHMIK